MSGFKYALLLSYNGSDSVGWQKQSQSGKDGSIQGAFESVLARCVREPVSVVSSGRTDAEVHAAAQVAHVVLTSKWDCDDLVEAANLEFATAKLPHRIRACCSVPRSFNAQLATVTKQYSYYIVAGLL
jgi:tRNA pseudouridine38-40 synthase